MTPRRPKNSIIILLLGTLSVVTPFAVDMYLPAFSRIAADFHTTTNVIALSLSTYFIGFAAGQLLYGPLLDRFGRKPPLYCGLVLYILASIGCGCAHSIHVFIALRFIQAIGGCAAQVASIAMVRDFFPAKESARIFSMLFLMIGVSPLLAPTVGSALMAAFTWRWIFFLLALTGAAILSGSIFLLPEGHTPDKTVSLHPKPILTVFFAILKQPQFLTYSLTGAFSFAGLFAYVAGAPIIFMDGFHLSTRAFGMVFALLTGGLIGGSQINVLTLRRFTSQQVVLYSLTTQTVLGVLFFAGVHLHLFHFAATLIMFFLFLSCIGLTDPNSAALALGPFTKETGSASALLGFLQMGIGSLISTSIGVVGASAIVSVLAGTALCALAILLTGRRITGSPILRDENDAAPLMH
jgi:DHA1 family bicyclomycin/chloramphenicol resistance-like MFS transporter